MLKKIGDSYLQSYKYYINHIVIGENMFKQKCISIPEHQDKWLSDNSIRLSKFVQGCIEKKMKPDSGDLVKTEKTGAWIKKEND